jgi:tetratricopeptide (TPR) repeat protein
VTKNKGKFGKGKAPVEATTDEFVSGVDRLAQVLRPHALRIAVVVGVVAVAVIAYSIWSWQRGRAEADATQAFRRVTEIASRPIVPPPEEPDKKAGDSPKADEAKSAVPTEFKSGAARAQAVLSELEKLDSDHGSVKLASEAKILRAKTLLDLGRYDDAAALYDEYAKSGSVSELQQVAREGIGYALEEKASAAKDPTERQKALEQALEAYANIQTSEKGPARDLALYHQGRVLAMLDRRDEAKAMFEKALAVTDTPLKIELESRLSALGGRAHAPEPPTRPTETTKPAEPK